MCCPRSAAFDGARSSGCEDRRQVFGHFGAVEQQRGEAFLIDFVDHDVAHRLQCRHFADAGEQARLAEAVAGCQAADFLQARIVVALKRAMMPDRTIISDGSVSPCRTMTSPLR